MGAVDSVSIRIRNRRDVGGLGLFAIAASACAVTLLVPVLLRQAPFESSESQERSNKELLRSNDRGSRINVRQV
ncbi:exported hypothetical protein [Candidatus Sulfopaludibacter sp. SbA3]|nr:exported hypothetical protein [Candidatus Sulfopaludibacter sp. SbA3]